MGLGIQFALEYRTLSRWRAHRQVSQLHRQALAMPFMSVGPVVTWCDRGIRTIDALSADDSLGRLHRQAQCRLDMDGNEDLIFESTSTNVADFIAFEVRPGRGCQRASFGLTRHRTTQQDSRGIPGLLACFQDVLWPWSRFSPWQWAARCETQFASNPAFGGKPNFAVCHLLVIGLLMRAELIGFDVHVHDQGGYWQGRSVDHLLQQVDNWNVATAGIVGGLQDLLGMPVRSPIKAFPDFEHLEAKFRVQSPPIAASHRSDDSAEADFDMPFGT